MTIDCGYGARLVCPKWNYNNISQFFDKFGPKMYGIFQSYHQHERSEGFNDSEEEYMPIFCEEYENEDYGCSGMKAVIADIINENEFNGETVFRADYKPGTDLIYVSADIPENEEEKARMLTKERIREILGNYLSGILDSGIHFEYIDITE